MFILLWFSSHWKLGKWAKGKKVFTATSRPPSVSFSLLARHSTSSATLSHTRRTFRKIMQIKKFMSWETTLRATIMTTTMTKMSKRKTKEQLSYLSCWSFSHFGKKFFGENFKFCFNFSLLSSSDAFEPAQFQYSIFRQAGNCSNVKNSEFNFPENFTTLFNVRILSFPIN